MIIKCKRDTVVLLLIVVISCSCWLAGSMACYVNSYRSLPITKLEISREFNPIINLPTKIVIDSPKSDTNQEVIELKTTSKDIHPINENGYLGKFRVTHYCWCTKCNGKWAQTNNTDESGKVVAYGASGRILNDGYSCAADTSIPFGTKLYIPQINLTVTVDDRAANYIEDRYNGKFVDIYYYDHNHYIEGASSYMDVYLVK